MLGLWIFWTELKFTDWERFQSHASEFSSQRIQTDSGEEADKADRDFTASVASAYSRQQAKSLFRI
jgi:hypothetical protein